MNVKRKKNGNVRPKGGVSHTVVVMIIAKIPNKRVTDNHVVNTRLRRLYNKIFIILYNNLGTTAAAAATNVILLSVWREEHGPLKPHCPCFIETVVFSCT